MKKLFILCLLFLLGSTTYALEVVYPSKENVTINSPSTFFIGSANPYATLEINSKPVKVHSSGGFAQKVDLNIGKNIFTLTSGSKILTYTITRQALLTVQKPVYQDYFEPKYMTTASDGVPLRSTPIDDGINRYVHLQKDIPLVITGEQGEFYQVCLSPSQIAWIKKSHVSPLNNRPAQVHIKKVTTHSDKNFLYYKISLSEKTPYIIYEGNPYLIKIFNTDDKNCETTFNLKFNQKTLGYDTYYINNTLYIKIRKQPKIKTRKPLSKLVIMLDAGHGGNENGTTGCLGTREKDFNLKITKLLKKELAKKGANVLMTRTDDKFVSLNERVRLAKANNAFIFISIHANALPDSKNPNDYRGASVYYYYDLSKDLAQSILNSMSEKMILDKSTPIQQSFAVVRNSAMMSLLIETAYAINPEDNALLENEGFQKTCAKQIAKGIENYVKTLITN